MDKTPEDQRSPNIMLSDYSLDSPLPIAASPASPVQHRPGYNRVTSLNEVDTSYRRTEVDGSKRDAPLAVAGKSVEESSQGRGLGIGNIEIRRPPSISRVAVGSPLSPPPSSNLLLSPTSTQIGSDSRGMEMRFEDEEMDRKEHRRNESEVFEPFTASSDRERLHENAPSAGVRSHDPSEFEYRAKQRLHHGRANWQSIAILSLALYSTVGSGIWLAAAMIRPRWGRRITTTGSISPATASLLCTAFAKTIELSFVTVFVAFLGQVLSRRAFISQSKGITVADMSMRAWVMQPGTMITNWQTVRYAAVSYLGFVSLLAALMAMLYTTASDALVSPKLKYGGMESRLIYGKVATSFANPYYLKDRCKTPISKFTDPVEYENSCVGVEHAGQSYHNYEQFITQWTDDINNGNGSALLKDRPRPIGMLYDNTTVVGSWIHEQNITALSQKFSNRIINNVSMAMPHAGVFSAARDPLNDILQPQDLSGLGEYTIRASVPSPAVNVLCANAVKKELDPLVYSAWRNSGLNHTSWPEDHGLPDANTWLDQNATVLDDIFEWGKKFDRQRPIFAKYPMAYNTILNTSKTLSDSIYLLATTSAGDFTLCSIRGSLTPNCSTEYHSSMSGGVLSTTCEDPTDDLSYHRSEPRATNGILNKDWINIAFAWVTSISLNDGIEDGKASIARILTQLILANPTLNPSLPSIAETLAVLSGCTLLLSTLESPYIHYWNYSDSVPTLAVPQYQAFNASLRFQDYASSGTQPWQNVFYIVLFIIFVTNVVCLAYLGFCRGLVTDFIEPHNLFNLSLNSPPSKNFDGGFGSGAEKEQLQTNWIIKHRDQDQFYIQEGEKQPVRRKNQKPIDYEMQSPIGKVYSKLASTRNSVF